MTKKVSKKNLLCLFPPKTGKPKNQEYNEVAQPSDFPKEPDSTSDWQTHYDFLEMAPWGTGVFGALMPKEIEEIALRALKIASESGDKYKTAKSYRHLFAFYCEFNHPDLVTIGVESVVAAVMAYGHSTAEVGEELSMLAYVHTLSKNRDQAIKALDGAIKIFERCGTTERLFEALESAICSASELECVDKVEEYARKGIRMVKKHCKRGSFEYKSHMEYYEEVLATADYPPVPIEEQRRQLLSMFPNLQKVFESKRGQLF